MKLLFATLSLASIANAHTLFSTMFVNGENQGDGTCLRMPNDPETATGPTYPLTGDVMACGRDGDKAVPFVCAAPGGATLTFEFRVWPDAEEPGAIDPGHQGPCAVYIKKVDDMFSDPAAGPGWSKIWEDGYDTDSGKWCVDTLIENNGKMSVKLPSGLPSGYYLVRPEILALHQAYRGDPQFFTSCAQVFIEDGPKGSLDIPGEYAVSIPGHIEKDEPGLTFNLYEDSPSDYKIPGPKVYIPKASSGGSKEPQTAGAIPSGCILKNANWCAASIGAHSDVSGCWEGVEDCWAQSKNCWSSAPVSGHGGCDVWSTYCTSLEQACDAGEYDGPPEFKGKEVSANVPGDIPAPWNDVFEEADVNVGSKVTPSSSAAASPSASPSISASPTPVQESSEEDEGESSVENVELRISKDGRCGGDSGQTCQGSSFGDCCSKKGKCGRKTRHCTCGCQPEFGTCR